ncbi:hypothetical protein ACMUMS_17685, partial [Acinetobacter courvalinii]|uniref:hypothetical protein n=1 Tax=Acinetobacter courvalinii TaxID=280147 RepID=UPI003A8AF0D4
MAKLTYSQKSALNVLDLLFFRDVESLSSFRDGKNLFYADFLGEINRVNLERNHQGGRAELYTHYLLCGIEMKFSVLYPRDDVEQCELISSSKFVFNTLRNEIVKHGFLSDEFNWDISDLFEAYKNHPNLDRGVVSSLVRDCLYFDFDSSAVVVYKKFLDLKIVKTVKYDSSKSKIDIDLLERAFLRSMLFIEFEVLKKQFHIKNIMEIRTIEIDLSLSLAEIEDEFKALISMKKSILLLEENFDHIYDINIK